MGAIHTPKVLMQSGIGDEAELHRVGLTLRQHLPGVGRNFQDHFGFDCVWQFPETVSGSTQVGSTMFWDSGMAEGDQGPDLFACLGPFPKATPHRSQRALTPRRSQDGHRVHRDASRGRRLDPTSRVRAARSHAG
jgi:choline dehydrogenase-like flavoprotein